MITLLAALVGLLLGVGLTLLAPARRDRGADDLREEPKAR